jgi:hypothetical protein
MSARNAVLGSDARRWLISLLGFSFSQVSFFVSPT